MNPDQTAVCFSKSAAYIQMPIKLLLIMEANTMNIDQIVPKGAV